MKFVKIALKMIGSWALLNLLCGGVFVLYSVFWFRVFEHDRPQDMKEVTVEGTLWSISYTADKLQGSGSDKKQYKLEFKIPLDFLSNPENRYCRDTVMLYAESYSGFQLGDKRKLKFSYDANSPYPFLEPAVLVEDGNTERKEPK